MTQLATFIDPESVDRHCAEIVKRAIVSIAIVKGSKSGKLVAAIIDESESDAKDAERILLGVTVPVFIGSVRDFEKIGAFLGSISSCDIQKKDRNAYSARFREVTNLPERKLISAVKQSLGILPLQSHFRKKLREEGAGWLIGDLEEIIDKQRKKFNVFEEYALTRIVDVSELTNYVHLQRYRVDVLIAESAPSAKPLLVIEFDGNLHTDLEKTRNDLSRDSVLIDAQLPVLRISSRTKWNSQFFYRYVRLLVSRLVEVIQFNTKKLPSETEAVKDFRKRLARFRREKGILRVEKDIVEKLWEESFSLFDEMIVSDRCDAAVEECDSQEYWMRKFSADWLASLLGKNVHIVKKFTTIGEVGGDNGFCVEALIAVDGREYAIRSPDIFMSVRSDKWQREYQDIAAQAAMACAFAIFSSDNAESV